MHPYDGMAQGTHTEQAEQTQEKPRETPEDLGAPAAERFLRAIEAEAALPPHVSPVEAAVATTRALFERLTAGQGHAIMEALPVDVRPLFEHGFAQREGHPISHVGRAELVDHVADQLGVAPAAADAIAGAVFRALGSVLPPEVVDHVAHQLPRDLQHLWLSPAAPAPEAEGIPTEPELLLQLLHDIDSSGTLSPRVSARTAFSTVMCLFSQRLSGGETKNLVLGLPRTVRPLVDRCLPERREPSLTFGRNELIANVASDLGMGLDEAEALIGAVMAAVKRILPRDEIDHVSSQLPEDLRRLWAE